LHEHQHYPTNEIGSVEFTSTSGFNLSAGPTLNPAPPFASLSSTVGYSESTSQTTKADNFKCKYTNHSEWHVMLAHYLKTKGILVRLVTPVKFNWVDSPHGHPVASIPEDAMRIVEKTFTQSYVFEVKDGDELQELTYKFSICGHCDAQFSDEWDRTQLVLVDSGHERNNKN